MTVSEYGRKNGKAFKYTELREEEIGLNELFSDLVDHWMRYRGWNDQDSVHPQEDILFEGVRDDKELRMKYEDETVKIEYGLKTRVDNSLDYVESVWKDEIEPILERNSEDDIEDFHVKKRTLQNLSPSAGAEA